MLPAKKLKLYSLAGSSPVTETFTVSLPAPRLNDTIVSYSTAAGLTGTSATANSDYTQVINGTVTIPAGFLAVTFPIDAVDEFASGDLPWNLQLRPGYPSALDDELAELFAG